MLNAIIRFSLQNRLLVMALAAFLVGFGAWQATQLPIDVFPDLDRPRVVILTEAPGMAPEEVETLISFPLETALNGATGVQTVRSDSGVGLSVVYVEFDWGSDIYNARQVVNERVELVAGQLPQGVRPQLAPISSIMGQILNVGMFSEGNKTDPLQLRTLADWVVRQRLLTIPGVAQVYVMGGQRKQFQVLADPHQLVQYGVTLNEVKTALAESNQNSAGGYLDQQGPHEYLVRAVGRLHTVEEIERIVVKPAGARPVLLRQVARVVEGPQVKRGDSSAYVRNEDGSYVGGPAVVLTINKQPKADTRVVTEQVVAAVNELQSSLPKDIRIAPELYQQKAFIDRAIHNVIEALRDGTILVIVILFLFLLNFRTTFITLTAIPLSLVITVVVFTLFGLSINTMTLGGLAVAMGELVDDAIVDVENIFRRLRENRHSDSPKHPLLVIYQASVEIRNSIVFSTIIIVLVFLPMFFLTGMEGRLFAPLGVAYVVSILASLLVSLTVTPVLSYWLLADRRIWHWVAGAVSLGLCVGLASWLLPVVLWLRLALGVAASPIVWVLMMKLDRGTESEHEGWLLRSLKAVAERIIRFSVLHSSAVFTAAGAMVAIAAVVLLMRERDFLPPFNEGAWQINVLLPPGASLSESNRITAQVAERLKKVNDISAFVRKTGRAELDEHAEGVNVTEIIATIDPQATRSREAIRTEIDEALADIPGIVTGLEQPLQHLMTHMLSGVKAQIAIKVYGDDLDLLRRKAQEVHAAVSGIEGVRDLQVEQQTIIPQLRIDVIRPRLETLGLRSHDINEFVATAMQGEVVSQILDGQRTFDLVVRLDDRYREDLDVLKRLAIDLPGGGQTKLEDVARIYPSGGPNVIKREQVRRRMVVQCNVGGRGLVDVVQEMKEKVWPIEATLPTGYFVEYGGQFQAQQEAATIMIALFVVSLVGMFLVLHTLFGSVNLSLQVMAALPMAFIGSVAALWLTDQTLTIAAMVGFISMAGIASRNGILLLNHYIHLVRYEGESFTVEMVVRGSLERLAPVLMTALTAGIALVPLALAAGEPGKEILYPVATVIIGGLISSTLLEYFVHPALFWKLGRRSAERMQTQHATEPKLLAEIE